MTDHEIVNFSFCLDNCFLSFFARFSTFDLYLKSVGENNRPPKQDILTNILPFIHFSLILIFSVYLLGYSDKAASALINMDYVNSPVLRIVTSNSFRLSIFSTQES